MLREHEIQIRVRYSETDAMGFLHHSNYFVYFEMGRTELLRAGGGRYREMEERGEFMVVVKIACQFKSPARYDDLLTLRTRISRVTAAKLEHEYQIRREGILIAEAQSTLACLGRDGRPQLIPEAFTANLSDSEITPPPPAAE